MLLVLLSSSFGNTIRDVTARLGFMVVKQILMQRALFGCCGLFVQGPCFMPFLSDGILGVVSYSKEKRRTT
jgi:hypothetical protein